MKYFIHLFLVLLLMMGLPMSARSDTISVPFERSEIQVALDDLADPGDTVLVSNRSSGDPSVAYQPFTMESGVKVLAAPNQAPIVDGADTVSYAVDWPATSSSTTILRGFTVRGGTSASVRIRDEGVIESCAVEKTSAPSGFNAIRSIGSTTIDDCSVSVLGSYTNYAGIYQTGRHAQHHGLLGVRRGRLRDPGGLPKRHHWRHGLQLHRHHGHRNGSVRGERLLRRGRRGRGLRHVGLEQHRNRGRLFHRAGPRAHPELLRLGAWRARCRRSDSVKVHNITVDVVYEGFNGYDQTISNCIVTNHYNYAYRDVNAEYCIAYGDPAFETGSEGTGSKNEDPLYCDADGDEYALRVDSWGNPEINGHGLIGAFPVACMYGTLQRDAEFTVGGTLDFTGDVVIPDTTDLTLGEDTILDISDSDGESGGSNTSKVELIVESGGSLLVEGTSGHEVQFGSDGTEGDWYGVHVEQGGSASIEYAEIEDASYGVIYQGSETGSISYCTFSNNEVDIYAGAAYDDMDLTVSDNTLTVGSGIGILWVLDVTGATVDNNELTGSGGTSTGIKESTGTGGAAPTYTGTRSAGSGLESGMLPRTPS